MFSWFRRDPTQALRRRYEAKMQEAMTLQRHGDIPRFAEVHAEAMALLAELEALEAEGPDGR